MVPAPAKKTAGMDNVIIPIGKTSKNAESYARDDSFLTQTFKVNRLMLPDFKEAIRHNHALFTKKTTKEADLTNLQNVLSLLKINERDQGVMDREEQRNNMQDLESLIKQTVHSLPVRQKELMYADLKNDFMETLLLPCTGFCSDSWEGSWTGTITFLGSILICIVFYILCLVWLFYAYVAVTNCGGPTLTASDSELCRALAECNITTVSYTHLTLPTKRIV